MARLKRERRRPLRPRRDESCRVTAGSSPSGRRRLAGSNRQIGNQLAAFLKPFALSFRRSASRHLLERYGTGLLTYLPRKNCEAIAQAVANTSLEQLQH